MAAGTGSGSFGQVLFGYNGGMATNPYQSPEEQSGGNRRRVWLAALLRTSAVSLAMASVIILWAGPQYSTHRGSNPVPDDLVWAFYISFSATLLCAFGWALARHQRH